MSVKRLSRFSTKDVVFYSKLFESLKSIRPTVLPVVMPVKSISMQLEVIDSENNLVFNTVKRKSSTHGSSIQISTSRDLLKKSLFPLPSATKILSSIRPALS